jgi:hypothetical protein
VEQACSKCVIVHKRHQYTWGSLSMASSTAKEGNSMKTGSVIAVSGNKAEKTVLENWSWDRDSTIRELSRRD